tara:strand:- start:804 stop:1517 length:714 start_codon:yes stop_codon:yes gene_type:complete
MFKKIFLVAAVCCGFSGFAQAEFVTGDWLEDGDNQAILDTRTGKEWLNMDHTEGMTVSEVKHALNGELSGWRIAEYEEIIELVWSQLENIGQLDKYWSDEEIEYGRNPDSPNYIGTHIPQQRYYSEKFSLKFGGINNTAIYGHFVNEAKGSVSTFYSQYTTNERINGMYIQNVSPSGTGNSAYGWWLVSDGGTTLESIRNPEINANNPDSPINDVGAPLVAGGLLFAPLFFFRRRKH